MTKFKKGDSFIAHKPKENYTHLFWDHTMDQYDGQTLIVEFATNDEITASGVPFLFHPDWCEKVEEFTHPINEPTKYTKAEIELLFKREDFITNLCLSYRHDYGLLSPNEMKILNFECKEWLRAIINNWDNINASIPPMKAGIEMTSDEHIAENSGMDKFPIENHIKTFSQTNNHIPDVGKVIDWEQRKWELLKECSHILMKEWSGCDPEEGVRRTINWVDEMIKQLKAE